MFEVTPMFWQNGWHWQTQGLVIYGWEQWKAMNAGPWEQQKYRVVVPGHEPIHSMARPTIYLYLLINSIKKKEKNLPDDLWQFHWGMGNAHWSICRILEHPCLYTLLYNFTNTSIISYSNIFWFKNVTKYNFLFVCGEILISGLV